MALSGPRAGVPTAVPTAPPRSPHRAIASPRARPSRPHRRPCSKPTVAVRARHCRCPAASAVTSSSTVSGARAPSCRFFFRGMLSLAPSPSTPTQDRCRPPEPSPRRRTPPPIRFFPPPRQQGAPVSYRLHPHARRVASLSWVLERRLLLHLHHCSAAAGRDARPESGDRSGVCSRPCHAIAGRASRGRPGKSWAACAMHTG
jgi:hypothetical protein